MEKLKVHGKLLEKYIEESGRAPVLLQIKKKYELWANAKDTDTLKKKFIKYDYFFNEHFNEIGKTLGGRGKFAALIGTRLEEFCYLLFRKKCEGKGMILQRIAGKNKNILNWIGFDKDSKLLVTGHGADLAIGNWRKLSIKNGVSIGIEDKDFFIPKIIIECKQYVSLDMFRDLVTEAGMFKRIYPYVFFIIVCEIMELTDDFKRMKKALESDIDGFFAFRPGTRREPGRLIPENINNFEKTINDYIQEL